MVYPCAFSASHDGLAMLLAGDLAGHADGGLVRVQPLAELVVLHGEDIRAHGGENVQQLLQTARTVEQLDREFDAAVPRDEPLLDDALHKADVNIAAGHDAYDALALHVELAAEHCGEQASRPQARLSACSAP